MSAPYLKMISLIKISLMAVEKATHCVIAGNGATTTGKASLDTLMPLARTKKIPFLHLGWVEVGPTPRNWSMTGQQKNQNNLFGHK